MEAGERLSQRSLKDVLLDAKEVLDSFYDMPATRSGFAPLVDEIPDALRSKMQTYMTIPLEQADEEGAYEGVSANPYKPASYGRVLNALGQRIASDIRGNPELSERFGHIFSKFAYELCMLNASGKIDAILSTVQQQDSVRETAERIRLEALDVLRARER